MMVEPGATEAAFRRAPVAAVVVLRVVLKKVGSTAGRLATQTVLAAAAVVGLTLLARILRALRVEPGRLGAILSGFKRAVAAGLPVVEPVLLVRLAVAVVAAAALTSMAELVERAAQAAQETNLLAMVRAAAAVAAAALALRPVL